MVDKPKVELSTVSRLLRKWTLSGMQICSHQGAEAEHPSDHFPIDRRRGTAAAEAAIPRGVTGMPSETSGGRGLLFIRNLSLPAPAARQMKTAFVASFGRPACPCLCRYDEG